MRFAPWMLASGLAVIGVCSAFSCKTPNEGTQLTVTYAAQATVVSSTSAGGTGGTPAVGSGGAGGAGGSTGMTSTVASSSMSSSAMSSSSTGMFAEMPINDCCSGNNPNCPGSTKATDISDVTKFTNTIT